MTSDSDIPLDPLELNYSSHGILPHVGLHEKGRVFVQESSHSFFWFSGVMLLLAVGALFLPLNQEAMLNLRLKHILAIGCLWGGICGFAPYFVRNKYAQNITIDPKRKTVRVQQRGIDIALPMVKEKLTLPKVDMTFSLSEVLALQICHQKHRRFAGYQLNLVVEHDGTIQRHCLLKHAARVYVTGLANKYRRAFSFRIVDHSRVSQQSG